MLTRTLCAWGLALFTAGIVKAEAVITYEAFDDLTPDDPGIVLGVPGGSADSATVEIWLTPTDGIPTSFGAGGYLFDGIDHGNGIVTSPDGGITSSDHHWSKIFVHGDWVRLDPLPDPELVAFFDGEPVPLEGLLLGTLIVTANEIGNWSQQTNPVQFYDEDLVSIPLAPESAFFTVTVLPEPTTGAMVIGAMLLAVRRRRGVSG